MDGLVIALCAVSVCLSGAAVYMLFALGRRVEFRSIRKLAQRLVLMEQKLDMQSHSQLDELRAIRDELARGNEASAQAVERRMNSISAAQHRQIETVQSQVWEMQRASTETQERLRATVSSELAQLRQENDARLEQMRQTVDEKLSSTLDKRLESSFNQVGTQLTQVYTGLGEMQRLAGDLSDFKRVLTNVKARGTWAEVQLGALLEQTLATGQFVRNACVKPGSAERVEYAVVLPGDMNGVVYLPIDSKFPQEDYLRLTQAADNADPERMELASRQLLRRIYGEARTIQEKYINPPNTTDFAIMFLPTEGLYAEILRIDGASETLQSQYHVMPAGPNTLGALLNSLSVGFQTLAIQQRSSEVWQLLSAVKAQYGEFTNLLIKSRKKLTEAAGAIDKAERKSRSIERSLYQVQNLGEDFDATRAESEWNALPDDEQPLPLEQAALDDTPVSDGETSSDEPTASLAPHTSHGEDYPTWLNQ